MHNSFLYQFQHPQLVKALRIAEEAHLSIGQRRKYTDEPYFVHPLAVAEIVMRYTASIKQTVVALCHDVIEDVYPKNPYYSLELIEGEFGEDVACGVDNLTDLYTEEAFPDLNRAQRHDLEVKRLVKIPPEDKNVKLADIINNNVDIVRLAPKFAPTYLRELEVLLEAFRGHMLNIDLYAEAHASHAAQKALLLPV